MQENPIREQLSQDAAAGLNILPQLRLLFLAEALSAAPPRQAVLLNEEVAALCRAVTDGARRTPGWLCALPGAAPLPCAVPRHLLQAAILCFLRAAAGHGQAVVECRPCGNAAVLFLRGSGMTSYPGDLPALLRRLGTLCGGTAVMALGTQSSAALRLPLAAALPRRKPPIPQELLCDRYSTVHILLYEIMA